MGWILPAVLGIGSIFGQGAANRSAQAQNKQQQDAQLAWATAQKQQAYQYMQPWLAQGATPFAGASAGTRPQGPTMGQPFSQQIMGVGPNGPLGGPTPGPQGPPQAPPQQSQGQPQIPPQLLQQFQQWLLSRMQQPQQQMQPQQIMAPPAGNAPGQRYTL